MKLQVYLSGEIHSGWREELINEAERQLLPVDFLAPVLNHDASDNVGVEILGAEESNFWKDHKAAKINAIRIKNSIEKADVVVVKFGDKYKQWNAAFDAGYAAALGKSYIVVHSKEFTHALKEVDAQAMAVAENIEQVLKILEYITLPE
ncbi:YtoQ family protein [Fulvivirga sp. 29W222]|uniref:YtoQ family protein n=1 Tax=Fulvivirga marina TaxID=2494733 RepID=A0A937KCE1_9BACT|nr:YtoQ family protein [Fulvivirga marina]MBL6447422.1 YtoQ family protein [Fulvivirga marina]